MVTVKSTFPMNEHGQISEMDNVLCLKWNDACIYFTILVALDSKAEIKGQAKPRTRKSASWSTGGWHTRNKWQSSPVDGDAGAQSSHDKWGSSRPNTQWKEITHSMNQLRFATKDKKNTWSKFARKVSKRESEVMVTANELLGVENLDDETRKILEKGSRHL